MAKSSLSKFLFLSLIVVFAILYFVVIHEGKKIRLKTQSEINTQKKNDDPAQDLR
ncbi:MAG: hypothetical protein ACE5FU_06480 [Nitrospinota bacterium]